MFANRLRRWTSIEPALIQRILFAGSVFTIYAYIIAWPANTTHLPHVWPMLAHRLRRWPSFCQTLSRCVVFVRKKHV